ncbi:MAG TPA: pilus assembly protein TadG-related protein, partial [Microlunatus sp.]
MPRVTRRDGRTERGAVAVVVALLMVPVIGFAAIAIDVASMWSDRQRLQTGADASALAIAQDCARQNCRVPAQTASTMTTANFDTGATASVLAPAVTPTTGQVTVKTATVNHHLFAPLLGFDATQISAGAIARWGAPIGGATVLPLAFSWCEWYAQTGGGVPSQTTPRMIYSSKGSKTDCTGPSNLVVPGGFGWVDPNAGDCIVNSAISQLLSSSTGASGPGGCDAVF